MTTKDKLIEKLKEIKSLYATYCKHLLVPLSMRTDEWLVKGCEFNNKLNGLHLEITSLESELAKEPKKENISKLIDSVYDKIADDLKNAKLQYWIIDDDEHQQLVDHLSVGHDISTGLSEINNIVEQIEIEDLLREIKQEPEGVTDEKIKQIANGFFSTDPDCHSPKKGFIAGYKLAMESYKQINLRDELIKFCKHYWLNLEPLNMNIELMIDEYLQSKDK